MHAHRLIRGRSYNNYSMRKFPNLHMHGLCLPQPVDHQGNLIPDPEAEYYLFDRVINVSTTNAVPFGLRGTVMGIYGGESIAERFLLY